MIPIRKLFGGLGNSMFQYAYLYNQAKLGNIPDMYLQDEKYFRESKSEIKDLYSQNIKRIDMVSLHIRRGDYVDNPNYVDLTETDYYERATELFPDEKFLVFCADRQGTDEQDREWVKAFLDDLGVNYEMWSGETEIDDFNAMAGCKAHIMANSSFSWWASYVGGGRTIAPREWFTHEKFKVGLPANFEVI